MGLGSGLGLGLGLGSGLGLATVRPGSFMTHSKNVQRKGLGVRLRCWCGFGNRVGLDALALWGAVLDTSG